MFYNIDNTVNIMRLLFFIFNIILLAIFSTQVMPAQSNSSPLKPEASPKQMEAGLLFGLGQNIQDGIYYPRCEECQFENGDGFGLTFGLVFLRDFNKYLQWGSSVYYESKNISTSYKITEMVPVKLGNGDIDNRVIPFRNIGDLSFGFLTFQPFIQFSPYEFVYLRIGLSSSLIASSNITHTKELLKFRDTLSSGEIVSLKIDDKNPKSKILENRDIPDLNLFDFSVQPMLGFNINLSPQFYLSPYFQYSIPLTDISNSQKDFRIFSWRIMLELRMALQLRQ